MNELPFLPIVPKLGLEIQVGTKKYQLTSIIRNETDKFKECEIKVELVERFLRKPAKYAIHKEPDGPVKIWPVK